MNFLNASYGVLRIRWRSRRQSCNGFHWFQLREREEGLTVKSMFCSIDLWRYILLSNRLGVSRRGWIGAGRSRSYTCFSLLKAAAAIGTLHCCTRYLAGEKSHVANVECAITIITALKSSTSTSAETKAAVAVFRVLRACSTRACLCVMCLNHSRGVVPTWNASWQFQSAMINKILAEETMKNDLKSSINQIAGIMGEFPWANDIEG